MDIQQVVTLLGSSNAEDRREAIKLLANLATPAAHEAIKRAYQTEKDPQVRALMVKVEKYIAICGQKKFQEHIVYDPVAVGKQQHATENRKKSKPALHTYLLNVANTMLKSLTYSAFTGDIRRRKSRKIPYMKS